MTVNHSQEPLQHLVKGWPDAAPSSLLELANISRQDLIRNLDAADLPKGTTEVVLAFFAQVKEVRTASTAKSVGLHDLKAVHKALKDGMIRPSDGGWACYPLDDKGHRLPSTNGRMRFKVRVFESIPSVEELDAAEMTPPSNGSVLFISASGPEVFQANGTLSQLQTLFNANIKVADVIAYGDSPSANGTGIWSLRSNLCVLNSDERSDIDESIAQYMEEGKALWNQ